MFAHRQRPDAIKGSVAQLGRWSEPILMHWRGLLAVELAAAGVSVLGIVVTAMLLPETKGKSFEELRADERTAPALAGASV
jgi:hypothetical protein